MRGAAFWGMILLSSVLSGAQEPDSEAVHSLLPTDGPAKTQTPELFATLTASYGFTAQSREPWDAELWGTDQWVSLGYFGRWGSSFTLQGDLLADFSTTPLTADTLVPQVFLTWNASDTLVATLGKQRLLWGTAKVFPSLDRLEPLTDPSSTRKLVPGVAGIRLEFLPTHWLAIQVLGIPEEKFTESRGALRLDFLLWDVDMALGVVNYRGISWKEKSGSSPEALTSPQAAAYTEVSWFGDRFGLYLDTQVRTSRDRDFYLFPPGDPSGLPQLFTGVSSPFWVNLTAGFQTEVPLWNREYGTLLAEYHFQGDGWDLGETKNLRPLLTGQQNGGVSLRPHVGTLRRHYGYLGISGVPLGGPVLGSLSLVAGPESGFWLASTALEWRLDTALSLTAGFRQAGQWLDENSYPGDLLLLSWRSQLSLGISGVF